VITPRFSSKLSAGSTSKWAPIFSQGGYKYQSTKIGATSSGTLIFILVSAALARLQARNKNVVDKDLNANFAWARELS
jgi:hypothetical protein